MTWLILWQAKKKRCNPLWSDVTISWFACEQGGWMAAASIHRANTAVHCSSWMGSFFSGSNSATFSASDFCFPQQSRSHAVDVASGIAFFCHREAALEADFKASLPDLHNFIRLKLNFWSFPPLLPQLWTQTSCACQNVALATYLINLWRKVSSSVTTAQSRWLVIRHQSTVCPLLLHCSLPLLTSSDVKLQE